MSNDSGELVETRPEGVRAGDYELIEQAVMETARGRWFLGEFARRIRERESARVLAALSRLERAIEEKAAPSMLADADRPTFGRRSEANAPANEPDSAPARQIGAAAPASLDGGEICAIQEKLLDIVWHMRERGFDGQLCTAIDRQARRLERLRETGNPVFQPDAREIETPASVLAVAAPPDPAPETAPEPAPGRSCRPQMAPSLAAGIAQRAAAFAALDAMSERKRLELFA